MKKSLFASALISVLSVGMSSAAADDVHEGYACTVKLQPAEESGAAPTASSFGRLNVELRENADCSGLQTWIAVCSTDLYTLPLCTGGRHFSQAELQGVYTALVQGMIAGLRVGAFTPVGRLAAKSIWVLR